MLSYRSSRLWSLSLFLALALAMPAEAQKRGGDFIAMVYGNANSIDPNFQASHISRSMLLGTYETLLAVDDNSTATPMLASGVEASPDGLTYRFQLRRGVKFHNGKEMTSADVKASLERFARVSPDRITMAPVVGIDAPDPYSLVIRLKQVSASFLDRLASATTPVAVIPAEEAGKDLNKTNAIGTGPFQFVEWVPDSHIKLKRFDDYQPNTAYAAPSGFGGKKTVYLDTATFRVTTEASARVAALESGQVHLAQDIPVPAAKRLADNAKLKIHQLKTFNMPVLFLNHAQAPTDNLKFRQAIQAGVDNGEAMAAATDGVFELDASWLWPGNAFSSDAGKDKYNQNNLARAKQLLAESGYKGEPMILAINNIGFHVKIGSVILENLKAIGINVQVERMEWPVMVDLASKDKGWNVATAGFSSQPLLGAYAYQPLFTGPTNWPHIKSDPPMEEAWAVFNTSLNLAERKSAWAKVQQRTYDQVYIVKLGNQPFLIGVSAKVGGYRPYIGAERLWDVWLE
ncbi:MAG: ABC transporter substrate-binding protein [Proteobacteria bacterium]|nr:ABC transporter substrate-binding protein [Pseudomonadota bacterium]MBI3498206.1 ABC transporter substrate-binding protein [Pseudomonadota bacterium]